MRKFAMLQIGVRYLFSVKIRVHSARLWSTPEGWYGWLHLPAVFRCQVSATEADPLGRSRSWNGLSFTSVDLQLLPNQCSGFRIRFLL